MREIEAAKVKFLKSVMYHTRLDRNNSVDARKERNMPLACYTSTKIPNLAIWCFAFYVWELGECGLYFRHFGLAYYLHI